MKLLCRLFVVFVVCLLNVGCVHELPKSGEPRNVVLHFHHDIGWSYHDVVLSRSFAEANAIAKSGNVHARYHLLFYPAGLYTYPVLEMEIHSPDIAREDFDEAVMLPPGNYDLFVWSDYSDANLKTSFFFDSSDHSNILYSEPYNGNNELRDAFRAFASFTVQPTLEADYFEEVAVIIERPLARYEIVATDLREFLQREISRNSVVGYSDAPAMDLEAALSAVPLDEYSAKVHYTEYMPSCFDNFRNNPVDSKVGVSYDATITALSANEARIGFDYVMVNGQESGVKVAVEIFDKSGNKIASSNSFTVPTRRSQNTTVRGKFLTSEASSGVSIDPTFDGGFTVFI